MNARDALEHRARQAIAALSVISDAAAAAEALYLRFAEFPTEWSRESEAHHGTWRAAARAVLGMGESDE